MKLPLMSTRSITVVAVGLLLFLLGAFLWRRENMSSDSEPPKLPALYSEQFSVGDALPADPCAATEDRVLALMPALLAPPRLLAPSLALFLATPHAVPDIT